MKTRKMEKQSIVVLTFVVLLLTIVSISFGTVASFRDAGDLVVIYDSGADETIVTARTPPGPCATNPAPRNDAYHVQPDVVLSWTPGVNAAGPNAHEIYLGTDYDAVNSATTSSPEYKGSQGLDANSYDPGGLDLGQTYYWRIDEVDGGRCKGRVWSFTVLAYLVVDDMESYDPTANKIRDTWVDGWVNWTGSEVFLGTAGAGNPVHGGNQSMIYVYDSGDVWDYDLEYYSEIERTFGTPQDWTKFDVEALALYFYGDPNNDANVTEQMYVGLEDSRGISSYAEVKYGHYSDEDMNDIKVDDWQEWSIALADFGGVNLEQVKKVYIGLGIRGNRNPSGTPGGLGTVYFDDIRLYLPAYPVCWSYLTQCHGDSDNTGDVKDSDFSALKSSWYKCYPDPDYNPCADFDRDGCVKASDFLILKANWYQTVDANCPQGGTWPPLP